MLEPTSTKNTQDIFQMLPQYLGQMTPQESTLDRQEGHWTWQPAESSKKMKGYFSPPRLKTHLPSPRKAARGETSPGLPGGTSTAPGDAVVGGDSSKGLIFANGVIAEEQEGTRSPQTPQVTLQGQPQPLGFPGQLWDSSIKHTVLSSAQVPQADDFYRTDLERGLLPSWTEVSMDNEMALRGIPQMEGVFSQEEMCKPKTNIVFLKVHKSASSTVMNILFRFGEMHNLSFAFPLKGGPQLFYPQHFMARFVQGFSPGKPPRFNILCHHMRFLQPEVRGRASVPRERLQGGTRVKHTGQPCPASSLLGFRCGCGGKARRQDHDVPWPQPDGPAAAWALVYLSRGSPHGWWRSCTLRPPSVPLQLFPERVFLLFQQAGPFTLLHF